jgi:hypothetical protein
MKYHYFWTKTTADWCICHSLARATKFRCGRMRAVASATLLCAVPINKSNAERKSQIATRRFSRISPSMRAAGSYPSLTRQGQPVSSSSWWMSVRTFLRRQHHFSTDRTLITSSPYISVTYTSIAVKYNDFAHQNRISSGTSSQDQSSNEHEPVP